MTSSGLRNKRLWISVVAAAVVLLTVERLSERGTMSMPERPTVLLSLDRTLWHRLGFSRFTYVRSLLRAGAEVRVLDYSSLGAGETPAAGARRLLEGIDGLVLSGGGDVDPRLYGGEPQSSLDVRPDRDRFELALIDEAEARALPVLGICRGLQLVNVARGGTLETIRDDRLLRRRHARMRSHPVRLEPESRLAELFSADRLARVVSYHGQAVGRPGQGLEVVGWAEDGTVEALESAVEDPAWFIGVQWHPELSQGSRVQRRLFAALVAVVEARRSGDAG